MAELKPNFQDDQIQYALLRLTDEYDGHTTVKFVFILWIGERVKINQKALVATHKGDINEFKGVSFLDYMQAVVIFD